MSKKRLLVVGLVAAAATGIVLSASIALGDHHDKSDRAMRGSADMRSAHHAVEDAGSVKFWAVVQPFSGSLEKSDAYYEEFMEHFNAQGLDAGLEGFEPTGIIILHSEPNGAEVEKAHIGITVPSRMEVKDPLRATQVNLAEAASKVHVGPYEELAEVHAEIAAAAREKRSASTSWPVVLRLLNDPTMARTPKTEIVVPLEGNERQLRRDERVEIGRAVEQASSISQQLVSQKFEGSPEQIGKFLEEFMNHFSEQGLGDHLSSRDVAPLAILHANPESQRTIPIEIGLPVEKGAKVKEPLMMSSYRAEKAASYLHRGPYEGLASDYYAIDESAREKMSASASFPVALRLLSDPRKVSADDIKTVLIVPLKG